jgi:hypothetical protein
MVRVHPPASGRRRRGRRRSLVARVAIATLGAAVAVVALLAAALAISQSLRDRLLVLTGADQLHEGVVAVALAPAHLLRATTDPPPTRRIALDVKFKHMHKIHEKRSRALETGTLATTDDDFLPGSIESEGRTIPVQLRLSGDRSELLEGEKWPLRIHVKGDAHVFGMRRFDLKSPATHGFQSERLFLEHLRREDVVAPRSSFVDLTLNGKRIGLMTLEENASLELLESRQRRDGAFIRFAVLPGIDDSGDLVASNPGGYRIETLQPGDLDRSGKLKRSFKTARRLLRGYFAGSVPADDVFDAESWGRLLALADLWGARDALQWRNLRFYFNPLTARLEPVGRAPNLAFGKRNEPEPASAAPFAARLLEDPRIRNAYRRALDRIATEMHGPEFHAQWLELEAVQLRLLHQEYPFRVAFDLLPTLQRADRVLAAAGEAIARHEAPTLREAGSDVESPLPFVSVEETLARHPFLRWDATSRAFSTDAGYHAVDGHLILPQGAGLDLPAGTTLRFEARRGIVARGPLHFRGEADAPVVLEGPPGPRQSELWSGVYVVESSLPSQWTHVVVRNTGGFKRKKWELAGGVVFRKTRAELTDCRFILARTDDALNVVRGSFSIRNPTIVDAQSDGFDADYSEGSIASGVIERAAGDAIDLGGSHARVVGVRMSSIRDKAISVGERSQLTAEKLTIEHVGIGIAVKNGSRGELTDSTLHDVRDVALVAYVNRGEFGPAELVADRNRITNADVVALAQAKNRILIDGAEVKPVDAALDRLYKDGENER